MRLFHSISGLRAALLPHRNQQLGLVPTMGSLHAGHASLIQQARSEADQVVVSIFVNPLQFGPNEDFADYPRQLEEDLALCDLMGVDYVFAPDPTDILGAESLVQVVPPESMTNVLCGPGRPGFFTGVATIVTKLLNIVQPQLAYFGEKDAQQLAIIRRLVSDLNLPVEIRPCPIVRDSSGLALSSRNQYLSATQKAEATVLWRGLNQAKILFSQEEQRGSALIDAVFRTLAEAASVQVEYVELVEPNTLQSLETVTTSGLLAVAAKVGSARLIDNVVLRNRRPIIAIDGPASSGKSTTTRLIAEKLGLFHLDTGAMYRAIAWLVQTQDIALDDEAAIAELVSEAKIELIPPRESHSQTLVIVNQQDVTLSIRTQEVTKLVSPLSALRCVRSQLLKQQQEIGRQGGVVAEGRDIGTHVFPDAELKIFLTASVEERAKRRLQEFYARGLTKLSIEQISRDIEERDYRDSHREIAPLRKAPDAIEINTDRLT
ncbi:MAG: bifunctional pantoate--beta-alanine ligase/(d)CMP kinase, partial [Cyanobacteria bacterium P01_H01_bin.15]